MAYARFKSRRYAGRRRTKRTARPTRRYAAKKRTYRKKTSRRSILDVTSRKKRNGMLSISTTPVNGGGNITPVAGAAYIAAGGGPNTFLWNATAQSLDATSVVPNQASRTATTCYMKGLSEHLRVSTSSGLPWFHRRICFTSKLKYEPATNPGATVPRQTYFDGLSGIERLWFNISRNNDSADELTLYGFLFRGVINQDWTDPIIAPVDPTRVTKMFDRTYVYKSGNQVGTHKEHKLYHSMEKSLVYDDDEAGEQELQSYYSTTAKPGMGNYFVVDIFSALAGGTSSDILKIDSNATLYWHEK